MKRTIQVLRILNNSYGYHFVIIAFLFLIGVGPRLAAAIELSEIPMFTRILPPPANIMFVIDDSGSMNFDILVRGGTTAVSIIRTIPWDNAVFVICSTMLATMSTAFPVSPIGMPV